LARGHFERRSHRSDHLRLLARPAHGRGGGPEILLNPYADAVFAKGNVQVRIFHDVDVAVRHPESFAATDLTP
jgi:hypothetical protein